MGGIYEVNKTSGELSQIAGGTLYADAPVGSIISFGGNIIPSGWLACSGQAISRTDYAELFAVIGTTFGSGNGSTTFNLPNLRDKAVMGAGINGALGASQLAQLPNITGKIDNKSGTFGIMGFSSSTKNFSGALIGSEAKGAVYTGQQNTSACKVVTFDASHSDASTDINGNNVYTNNGETRPANVRVNFIIKAKKVGAPTDFIDAISTILKTYTYPANYTAIGTIFTGNTIRGYGKADVTLYPNGIARVDYAIEITTSYVANEFGYGISPDALHTINSNIPLITPITPDPKGNYLWLINGASGIIKRNNLGFSSAHGRVNYNNKLYWQLGRIYNTSATYGGWPTSEFAVGDYITGTCWGTFSV
jgi:microcystin-dependent protein